MSLLIKGVVRGVKKISSLNHKTGVEMESYNVGFESARPNGYEGETIIRDVRISKKQRDNGLVNKYQEFVGKEVVAPVFVQPWTNGKSYSTYFSDDGLPLSVSK